MSHRSEYFELIDKYINNELIPSEASELELKMEFNAALLEEFELQMNVQKALQEQDIVNLRENMHKIVNHQSMTGEEVKPDISNSFNFGLADELTDNQNFNDQLNLENINDLTHSFPKIHLYQHLIAAKENIYQFYKEQQEGHSSKKDQESFSVLDEALFEDIKDAMQENDLLDLRANLKQIASSVSHHEHSAKDIHNYVDQTMTEEQRVIFEEKIAMDLSLANEVRLFQEIDLAIPEDDIMNLRASLQEIQKSAIKFKSGIKEIDGYIYNELSESELTLFESELANNKKLYAEIDLIKNIDVSLQEKDIMKLRASLSKIATENIKEKQIERSIHLRLKPRTIAVAIVAASLTLLIGLTSLFRTNTDNSLYDKFHSTYETTGVSRSSNSSTDKTFTLALQKYDNKEYQSAVDLLQEVISKDQNNVASHFYSGVSLQELGKYKNAIDEYQVVVIDKDNLFMEQAEWYIGLCYIQINEDKKAIKQFKKIAGNKGYYQQKAEAILDKIKSNQ